MINPTITRLTLLAAGSSALVLAACSPAAEAPSAPEADASSEPMAMAQTPFSAAETEMHEAMRAATGANAGESWARKMIPHHQGAIDMAKVVLQYGEDPEVKKLAEDVVKAQESEIAMMQKWLADRGK